MSEQIIIGVPGVWKSQAEVSQALVAQNNNYIFAGFTLMDTASQDVSFVEMQDYDPRLVDVFETLGDASITDQELQKIAQHHSTLWVLSPEVSISQARRMMNVGMTLLKAGGLAIKVETSGVAHSATRWNEFANADALQPMYCAYVNLIEGDDYFYSCGMHNFGLPDVSVTNQIGAVEATNLLNHFNTYQLEDLPQLDDGDYFSLDETARRYRLTFEACEVYEPEHPFYNPFGRWHLLKL
ncbi:MAG: DUF4261 domain-containing protein [Acidobacteria bacterium]|nr:DUF4261 domain-containing protein [Acidobacteriota bacterium]MBI3427058.1 DUF4261 domain-containing protein [Acidobacteriota bacterium]